MNILGVFIGLSVLLIVVLAMNISRLRMSEKVANGDGNNKRVKKAIRAHMNALEHILPFALLLYFLQAATVSSTTLSVLAFGFLIVRYAHAYSMLASNFRMRQMTAGFTYAFELVGCFLVIALSF